MASPEANAPRSLPLPIDAVLPQIVAALQTAAAIVIEAPPGAGKTTRVPRALLEAGVAGDAEILVLQPRRLPARLAAQRVAEEMGESPGGQVGYQVRFEDVSGPRTRLCFITEGILSRRLVAEPTLPGVAMVVLDEFHERHIHGDLGLALLRRLQLGARPDLKLCVMSATLDAGPVRAFLGDCPNVRSFGRAFEVAIEYRDSAADRPLSVEISAALRDLVRDGLDGDVLVFLPGAGEIRRAAEALAPLAAQHDLLLLPLHGELPPAEQDRAVRKADRRKIILATNVAETSVTIDGVVAVVDSGLARIAAYSPWTRLPTLTTAKVSQASAIQRAGRAGRTRPGRALRLYTRHDFEARRSHELPEIERLDLAEPLLLLAAAGVRDVSGFPWFEPPPPAGLAAGQELLRRLGAIDAGGAMTETGRALSRFPLHPRLGRLVVEGERRGVGEDAAALAALVAERDIGERARPSFGGPRGAGRAGGGGAPVTEDADLLERLDRFRQAQAARFSRDRLRALGLDGRAVDSAERARRQIAGLVRRDSRTTRPVGADAVDQVLALATLAAFPDRVARRRGAGGGAGEIVFAGGGTAAIGSSPAAEFLVAVDVEERGSAGHARGSGATVVRLAVGIEPEWLLELFPDDVRERDELAWNETTARVDRVAGLSYGLIVLDETRRPADASPEAARVLAVAAQRAGVSAFLGDGKLAGLEARLAVLREALGEAEVPVIDEAALAQALTAACEGRTSFADLRDGTLDLAAAAGLTAKLMGLLRAEAPERVRLPGGRDVEVHYEPGKPPWIESRLQDFFGMAAGPVVARGRMPLVLHLLAPNGRAVQVTRDLANFWRQHYPALRRELGRRYPRHPWPEDGATAAPPPPKPPRPR